MRKLQIVTHLYNVYDAEQGKQVQQMRVDSSEAQKLLKGMQPDGKEYSVEEGGGGKINTAKRLQIYDAAIYHLARNPRPLRVIPLDLPSSWHILTFKVSPDHQHLFYAVGYEQSSPTLIWLHRWLPQVKAPIRNLVGLWTSRTDGTQLHEIGHKERVAEDDLYDTRWLPDSRHLSWDDQQGIYTVPVE